MDTSLELSVGIFDDKPGQNIIRRPFFISFAIFFCFKTILPNIADILLHVAFSCGATITKSETEINYTNSPFLCLKLWT